MIVAWNKRNCVISHTSNYIAAWDTFVNILYIISFLMIPLVIASDIDLLQHLFIIEIIFDVIMLADMIVTFFLTYNDDIRTITSLRLIAIKYVSSYFVFDFLSIVPGLATYESYKPVYYFKLFRYFQLGRLFDQLKVSLSQLSLALSSLSRKGVEQIVSIVRAMFFLLFTVHMLAWVWVLIGRTEDKGWIKSSDEFKNGGPLYLNAYPAAVYFVTLTLTTVGYGAQITPTTNTEIVYVMVIELIGLAAFSYILGVLKSIEFNKSSIKLIIEKKKNIAKFLDAVNNNQKELVLPHEILERALSNLDMTYNYSYNYVFYSNEFYSQIKPRLKSELLVSTLSQQYIKFIDFFTWQDLNFQSSERFIMQVLVNLECVSFLPEGSIINRGEQVDYIYFIEKGTVTVSKMDDGLPYAVMPRYSFIGDYQVLLGICSNATFKAHSSDYAVWYILARPVLMQLLNKYPRHHEFLLDRAISTRKLFKRLERIQHEEIVNFTSNNQFFK